MAWEPAGTQSFQLVMLTRIFPFWKQDKIIRILNQLSTLGILKVEYTNVDSVRITSTSGKKTRESQVESSAFIKFKPDEQTLQLLELHHGIDQHFSIEQSKTYPAVAGQDNRVRFRQHVITQWRLKESRQHAFHIHATPTFDKHWRPSEDVFEILHQGGIARAFAESVLSEFILYWLERGGPPKEVNSRFLQHTRQCWTRYSNGLEHTTLPQRLRRDWKPDPGVYETLELAGIDEQTARSMLQEFVLYWVDSNELNTSWNSKFLQHVKYQWRREKVKRHERDQESGPDSKETSTKDRSISDDLSDTSWVS